MSVSGDGSKQLDWSSLIVVGAPCIRDIGACVGLPFVQGPEGGIFGVVDAEAEKPKLGSRLSCTEFEYRISGGYSLRMKKIRRALQGYVTLVVSEPLRQTLSVATPFHIALFTSDRGWENEDGLWTSYVPHGEARTWKKFVADDLRRYAANCLLLAKPIQKVGDVVEAALWNAVQLYGIGTDDRTLTLALLRSVLLSGDENQRRRWGNIKDVALAEQGL